MHVVGHCPEIEESTQNIIKERADEYEAGQPQMVTESENSEKGNRARAGKASTQVIDYRNGRSKNADLNNSIRQGIELKEVIKRQIVQSACRAIKVERQIVKSASRNTEYLLKDDVREEGFECAGSPADSHVHHLVLAKAPVVPEDQSGGSRR